MGLTGGSWTPSSQGEGMPVPCFKPAAIAPLRCAVRQQTCPCCSITRSLQLLECRMEQVLKCRHHVLPSCPAVLNPSTPLHLSSTSTSTTTTTSNSNSNSALVVSRPSSIDESRHSLSYLSPFRLSPCSFLLPCEPFVSPLLRERFPSNGPPSLPPPLRHPRRISSS